MRKSPPERVGLVPEQFAAGLGNLKSLSIIVPFQETGDDDLELVSKEL
jgi:hypothetical protein